MGQQKKSTLGIGMLTIGVRLELAADSDGDGFKVVCTGKDGVNHDPVRTKTNWDCPACSNRHSSHWGYPDRAVESEGQMVLVTADEIKAASGAPIKNMTLSFHEREQVHAHTLAANSVQNVYPDKGFEKPYRGLVEELTQRPNIVACTIWAPSTKNALWMLEVVDGRLVASKRCWPEDVRAVQGIAPSEELSDAERTMLGMFIENSATDFSLELYKDARREGVAQLLAERGVSYDAAGTETTASGDMLAALQASVDALNPPKRARKAPAKKAVKAPVKKTAAKKAVAKKGVAA